MNVIIGTKGLRADKTVGSHETTGWYWLICHLWHWRHCLVSLQSWSSHWCRLKVKSCPLMLIWCSLIMIERYEFSRACTVIYTYQGFGYEWLVVWEGDGGDVSVLVVAATRPNRTGRHHQWKARVLTFRTTAVVRGKRRVRVHHVDADQTLDLKNSIKNSW